MRVKKLQSLRNEVQALTIKITGFFTLAGKKPVFNKRYQSEATIGR